MTYDFLHYINTLTYLLTYLFQYQLSLIQSNLVHATNDTTTTSKRQSFVIAEKQIFLRTK